MEHLKRVHREHHPRGKRRQEAGNSHPSEPRPLAGDPDREQGTAEAAVRQISPAVTQ
jgi:hypothetical protein